MAVSEDVDVQVEPVHIEPIQPVRPLRRPTPFINKNVFELPLAPRKLGSRTRRRNDVIRACMSIFLLTLAGAFAFMGFFVSISGLDDYVYSDCEEATSSGIERYFQVNVRLPKSFTYSTVRLIDISWDIVVGQGGRFLHAWILYRTVIAPNLGRIMELTGVPYVMFVDLSFQPATAQAVITLAKSFIKVRGWRVVVSMVWHMLAIGYVLAFSTIWNASSGYLNPTVRYYRMPDNSYISASQTDLLSFCWVHDDPRIMDIVPNVTNSPSLRQLNTAGLDLVASKKEDQITQISSNSGYEENFPYELVMPLISDEYTKDFMSLAYYTVTQNEILSTFNYSHWRVEGPEAGLYNLSNAGNETLKIQPLRDTYYDEAVTLHSQISGWQYGTAPSETEASNALFNSSWSELNDTWAPTFYDYLIGLRPWKYRFMPTTGWETAFTLNTSVVPGPGIVPYNSSLAFNGTLRQLSAPFVRFGQTCSRIIGIGGPCLCYNGEPIPYQLGDDDVICASESGYVWGFSSSILSLGLFLECVWLLGCWGVWLDAHINSDLSLKARSGAGSVRSAFDLVEAAKRELGHDLSSYSDDELRQALKRCGLIGYEVKDDKIGTEVSVVPRDKKLRRRARRKDSDDTLQEEIL